MSWIIERAAQAVADARSSRRTDTAQRVRGEPTEISLAIARLDARAVIEVVRDYLPHGISRTILERALEE